MTGNSSGLDPTPKRNHRSEFIGRILADCHFLVDPTPKRIYSAEVRYSKRRYTNCSPPTTTTTPTTTYTVLGTDGFAAGKNRVENFASIVTTFVSKRWRPRRQGEFWLMSFGTPPQREICSGRGGSPQENLGWEKRVEVQLTKLLA